MSDVTYEYIRGQGWVPSYPTIITMACGKVVRLEVRAPVPGEYFQQVRVTSTDWVVDGKPTEKWLAWLKQTRFDYNNRFDGSADAYRVLVGRVQVVTIPVPV